MAQTPAVTFKKSARVTLAALLSSAMVGVFALPAYAASPQVTKTEAEIVYAQALTTGNVEDLTVPVQTPSAALQPVEEVVVETAAEEATSNPLPDLPAGQGAEGLVAAAYAQLGVGQDCTDLVQNSLSALGLVAPRLQGGPDLGLSGFFQFGSTFSYSAENLAPGDILVYNGHVALYVGGGNAIHGGWTDGGTHAESTVLRAVLAYGEPPHSVVRVG